MSRRITIGHLYPSEMNIYGDLGNVITLKQRLIWRGYEVQIRPIELNKPFDLTEIDILFGGGGQDRGQLLVGEDLKKRGSELRQLAADGLPMLLVCGLYQLFGHGFLTSAGEMIEGIGVFRATTVGGDKRMIGNIVIESDFGRLVGFENHSGQTTLEAGQPSLGTVVSGFGNDPTSRREGAVSGNAIGTYLHGPVLPKNPRLADHLIQAALERRYGPTQLAPLDDSLECLAAREASSRPV